MTKARDIATSEVVTGEIGSTIQAHDADLDSIAALDKTDGNVIVGDGTNWVAESGATARTSLGLGTAATTNSTDYATAAQGALADTALQPTGDGSGLTGIAGGFSNLQVFTSPGTWTNPGSVTKVKVTVVGGGGNGGNYGPTNSMGGGGGGGGAAIEVVPFPSGTNVPITVGGAGGTSSFGAYCSATGGTAGDTAFSNGVATKGGPGGIGSGGQLNIGGTAGGAAANSSGPPTPTAWGGNGGGSYLGGGGFGAGNQNYGDNYQYAAQAGRNYGGGGGGGFQWQGNTSRPGAAGAPGVVVVEY